VSRKHACLLWKHFLWVYNFYPFCSITCTKIIHIICNLDCPKIITKNRTVIFFVFGRIKDSYIITSHQIGLQIQNRISNIIMLVKILTYLSLLHFEGLPLGHLKTFSFFVILYAVPCFFMHFCKIDLVKFKQYIQNRYQQKIDGLL